MRIKLHRETLRALMTGDLQKARAAAATELSCNGGRLDPSGCPGMAPDRGSMIDPNG